MNHKLLPRPGFNQPLIYTFCCGRAGFAKAFHHGLTETPMREIYPFLNFREMAIFQAASWLMRKDNLTNFRNLMNSAEDFGDLVDKVTYSAKVPEVKYFVGKEYPTGYGWYFHIRSSWIDKEGGSIPAEHAEQLLKLSPFKPKTMRNRLKAVAPEHLEELEEKLRAPTKTYWLSRKDDCEDSSGPEAVILYFLPIDRAGEAPTGQRLVEEYAAEISRRLSAHSRDYNPYDAYRSHDGEPVTPLPEDFRRSRKTRDEDLPFDAAGEEGLALFDLVNGRKTPEPDGDSKIELQLVAAIANGNPKRPKTKHIKRVKRKKGPLLPFGK
jgi:hypothetical protein